ncbi:polysaccharide biosynthesis/export family protein [Stieleria varia]|uniref:SLBB domain protein n=1 Tax=Stieleria varia TaxID=2528005 RepID=A0A5C6AYK6_9BACT|nr:SLBB domain-containing protein [Stieleria varia]TWU04748.1 SLBB domain protein [Stieleria varia]
MTGAWVRRIGCLMTLVLFSGCSSLGLSLYPAGATLTTEAEDVLNASRVPHSIARENAKTVLAPHTLQPGDAVLIEPLSYEQDLRLPADQTVMADGTIDLGPYGRVVVAGRDLEQAESLIEHQITSQMRVQRAACRELAGDEFDKEDILPANCDSIAVNVRLLEPVHRFYVLGEVNNPGAYPLAGYETVLDAIVAAGGLTSSADPCQILLSRPTDPCECRVTLPVCYREIVQLGNTASNYQLQPNDRVFIASRSCMDEILFWKADKPCARCSGCNQPCRNPENAGYKPMAMIENTMIPPGSVGMTSPPKDTATTSRSPTAPSANEQSTPAVRDPDSTERKEMLGDWLQSGPGTIPPDGGSPHSDADGELEFKPFAPARPSVEDATE